MNWYKKSQSYLDIGHETEEDRSFLWVFIDGKLEIKPVREFGTDEDWEGHSWNGFTSHSTEWGDRMNTGKHYSGRFDKNWNIVSVVPPTSQRYRETPSVIERALRSAFGPNIDIRIF